MSKKSSLDYTELAGLRIFATYYRFQNSTNSSANMQIVLDEVEKRIKQLEEK